MIHSVIRKISLATEMPTKMASVRLLNLPPLLMTMHRRLVSPHSMIHSVEQTFRRPKMIRSLPVRPAIHLAIKRARPRSHQMYAFFIRFSIRMECAKMSNWFLQPNKDDFGSDPFAILHAPTSASQTLSPGTKSGPPPRPESPSPALPPKKAKQPPPRPAPPRPLQVN